MAQCCFTLRYALSKTSACGTRHTERIVVGECYVEPLRFSREAYASPCPCALHARRANMADDGESFVWHVGVVNTAGPVCRQARRETPKDSAHVFVVSVLCLMVDLCPVASCLWKIFACIDWLSYFDATLRIGDRTSGNHSIHAQVLSRTRPPWP